VSNYAFNFVQADVTVTEMQQINQRIVTALGDLDAMVQKSIAAWEGSARDQYYVSKGIWDQGAQEMMVAFEQARSTLVQIGDFYGTTEQRSTMLWNGVSGA
jgi:WXG100 family type VII secretion target